MFNRYKNSLGAPRTGVHALRIPLLDVALVDVVLTWIAINALTNHSRFSLYQSSAILLLAGFIAHKLFAVEAVMLK